MKIRKLLLFMMVLCFLGLAYSFNVKAASIAGSEYIVGSTEETNNLGYGVMHYRQIGVTKRYNANLYDAQQVNYIEVPATAGVKVTTWANINNDTWTLTSVRRLIADYEQHNPGWTVLGAVNGDFFDISRDGGYGSMPAQTRGPVVSEGEYYRTRSSNDSSTTIGFKNDGSTNSLVGYTKIARTDTMKLAVYDENDNIINTFDVANLNKAPADGKASVYFGAYADLQFQPTTKEIVGKGWAVEEAERALPTNGNDFYGKGVITKELNGGSITLGKGAFVIDSKNAELDKALSVGTKIRVQFEFVGDFAECTSVAGVQATVMKDGVFVGGDTNRHPRTAIGIKENGAIVMMVVDGRQEDKNMYGATHNEIAAIMKTIGCVDAYNLDGGGSSTIVVKDNGVWTVKNSPSDGGERSDGNCMLVVTQEPVLEVTPTEVLNNKVTLNVNILNSNNHDIQELFIKCDGTEEQVVDGKVTFTRLSALTEYNCAVSYKATTGLKYQTYVNFKIATEAASYTLKGVDVEETADSFKFTVDYRDRSSVTNLPTSLLEVNGKQYTLVDGSIVIPKSEIGNIIEKVLLTYTKLSLQGTTPITVVNPHSKTLQIADIIASKYNEYLSDIFK